MKRFVLLMILVAGMLFPAFAQDAETQEDIVVIWDGEEHVFPVDSSLEVTDIMSLLTESRGLVMDFKALFPAQWNSFAWWIAFAATIILSLLALGVAILLICEVIELFTPASVDVKIDAFQEKVKSVMLFLPKIINMLRPLKV